MSNHPPFPNPNPDEMNEPADVVDVWASEASGEAWETVKFPNAIDIEELEGKLPTIPPASTTPPAAGIQPWAATPHTNPDRGAGVTQVSDLITLIQQLRQRNNELSHRVAALENTLHECQSAISLQQTRLKSQDALLAEQAQNLAASQGQILHLSQQLEASQQAATQHQTTVQTLTEKLEISQQRLAQIERECTLTQQHSSEQAHQLIHSEATCRDLRARLHRQQRHTLQFKAALEKCLESPDAAGEIKKITHLSTEQIAEEQEPESLPGTLQFPKATPIQPWAAKPSPTPAPAKPAPPLPPAEDLPIVPKSPVSLFFTTHSEAPADEPETNLWQDINQRIDVSHHAPVAPESTPASSDQPISEAMILRHESMSESQQPVQPSEPTISQNADSNNAGKPNWPSPLVYPHQPPKKRASLAAIDLPTFPKLTPEAT